MGFLSGVAGFFLKGGAGKVAAVADEFVHTAEERTNTDQVDLKDARTVQYVSHDSGFDVLVDAIIRLIRPGLTIYLIGGLIGWWDLRDIAEISQFYQTLIWLVFTFHFGGRALMKDIPSFFKAISIIRKQK